MKCLSRNSSVWSFWSVLKTWIRHYLPTMHSNLARLNAKKVHWFLLKINANKKDEEKRDASEYLPTRDLPCSSEGYNWIWFSWIRLVLLEQYMKMYRTLGIDITGSCSSRTYYTQTWFHYNHAHWVKTIKNIVLWRLPHFVLKDAFLRGLVLFDRTTAAFSFYISQLLQICILYP